MDKYVEGLGDLMKWMLKLDPATRPSAEEILQHPWFKPSGEHVERKESTKERYEGGNRQRPSASFSALNGPFCSKQKMRKSMK